MSLQESGDKENVSSEFISIEGIINYPTARYRNL